MSEKPSLKDDGFVVFDMVLGVKESDEHNIFISNIVYHVTFWVKGDLTMIMILTIYISVIRCTEK